jgi:hypothetical protein
MVERGVREGLWHSNLNPTFVHMNGLGDLIALFNWQVCSIIL